MTVLKIIAILAGSFALLNWLILPRLVSAVARRMPSRPLRAIMSLLIGRIIRSVCLIGATTLSAIVLALWAVRLAGYGLTVERLEPIYRILAELRERLERLDDGWAILTIFLLSAALWLSVRRDARKQFRAALNEAVEKAAADADATDSAPLNPSSEMAGVIAQIAPLRAEIEAALAARGPALADTQPDEALEPELAAKIGRFQALNAELHRLDVMRRLDVGAKFSALSEPSAQGETRLARLLASAGLVKGMDGVSRALGFATLVLLIPTLITISGRALAETVLQADVAIHDLIVADSAALAERAWADILPPAPAERELTPDDQSVIHHVALHYQHFARAHTALETHAPTDAAAVRRRILDDFAAAQPTRFDVRGGPDGQTAAAADGDQPARPEGFGPEATQAQTIIEEHAKRSSAHDWAALKEKFVAFLNAAGEPLSTGEISKRLFSEVLDTGGDLAFAVGPDSSAFRSLVAEVGHPSDIMENAEKITGIEVFRFVSDLRDRGAPDPAAHLLGASTPAWDDEAERWARDVQDKVDIMAAATGHQPPTLETRLPPNSELKPATDAVRDLMKQSRASGQAAEQSNLLTQYADIAPGVMSEEAHTPRGRLLSEFPKAVQEIAQGATNAAANFARARSYAALRGFAKIGGVLIGLGPDGGKGAFAPSVVGLDWTDTPRGLVLRIARASAAPLSYGPFRAEIVRQALAYAADGRPVTATMPLALPIGRRILIHPALVDSALGCESRLLDQFVDGATGGAGYRTAAEELVLDQSSLYEIAWADQFLRIDDAYKDKIDRALQAELASERDVMPKIAADPDRREAAARAVKRPASWSDPAVSPVTTKRAYFDEHLVADIGACIRSDGLGAVRSCIADRKPSDDYVRSFDWAREPPRPRPESGVRETPYTIPSDLDFLDIGAHASTPLWPFDFMLQVTFDSPPRFGHPDDSSFDLNPFEFPAIKQHIHSDVAEAVTSGSLSVPDAARVVSDLREFTVLQRFFRLALDGELGGAFPLDRLVALGKVSPHFKPPPVRTLTWNVNRAAYEEMKAAGLQPQLAALGYERDLQQEMAARSRCPNIDP